ncbi:hypothetical protein [Nonomuraea rubra]|uniref:hypothetical protein n=1 Tax=Nonomuraea rubra TaxID=46180 RepID=UPI0033FEC6FC
MLICFLPVEEPDLTVGPVLFADPRVLAVAAEHELTRRSSVSLEMLADFQHCDPLSRPDYWMDGYTRPTPARDARSNAAPWYATPRRSSP